jgi:hypothetical protein
MTTFIDGIVLTQKHLEWLRENYGSRTAITVAAWSRGVDVSKLLPSSTFYRQAAVLRELGIDITSKNE